MFKRNRTLWTLWPYNHLDLINDDILTHHLTQASIFQNVKPVLHVTVQHFICVVHHTTLCSKLSGLLVINRIHLLPQYGTFPPPLRQRCFYSPDQCDSDLILGPISTECQPEYRQSSVLLHYMYIKSSNYRNWVYKAGHNSVTTNHNSKIITQLQGQCS